MKLSKAKNDSKSLTNDNVSNIKTLSEAEAKSKRSQQLSPLKAKPKVIDDDSSSSDDDDSSRKLKLSTSNFIDKQPNLSQFSESSSVFSSNTTKTKDGIRFVPIDTEDHAASVIKALRKRLESTQRHQPSLLQHSGRILKGLDEFDSIVSNKPMVITRENHKYDQKSQVIEEIAKHKDKALAQERLKAAAEMEYGRVKPKLDLELYEEEYPVHISPRFDYEEAAFTSSDEEDEEEDRKRNSYTARINRRKRGGEAGGVSSIADYNESSSVYGIPPPPSTITLTEASGFRGQGDRPPQQLVDEINSSTTVPSKHQQKSQTIMTVQPGKASSNVADKYSFHSPDVDPYTTFALRSLAAGGNNSQDAHTNSSTVQRSSVDLGVTPKTQYNAWDDSDDEEGNEELLYGFTAPTSDGAARKMNKYEKREYDHHQYLLQQKHFYETNKKQPPKDIAMQLEKLAMTMESVYTSKSVDAPKFAFSSTGITPVNMKPGMRGLRDLSRVSVKPGQRMQIRPDLSKRKKAEDK